MKPDSELKRQALFESVVTVLGLLTAAVIVVGIHAECIARSAL